MNSYKINLPVLRMCCHGVESYLQASCSSINFIVCSVVYDGNSTVLLRIDTCTTKLVCLSFDNAELDYKFLLSFN